MVSFQDPGFRSDLFISPYLDPSSNRGGLPSAGSLTAFHQVKHRTLHLAADYRLLEAGVATHLSKIKVDHEEELRRARESISGEVKKTMDAPTVEAKKQVDEANRAVGIL